MHNRWLLQAKAALARLISVGEYLGWYTHKVTSSNSRIKNVCNSEVSFTHKDRKLMLLANTEFIRRFAQHILPKRFVRIRHYGILNSSCKRGRLQQLQLSLDIKRPPQKISTMLRKCRCCKTGTLMTIEVFPKKSGQVSSRGPPTKYLLAKQTAPVI